MELKTANAKKCIQPRGPLMARLRLRALAAASPLIVAELTFNLQCPLFQRIGLHAGAQPTWIGNCAWSHVDRSRDQQHD